MPYPRLPELRARVGGALFVVVACGLSWLTRQVLKTMLLLVHA